MSVVVHLSNGQVAELRSAKSCSWSPSFDRPAGAPETPRWLICRNERGEVVATYKEPDIKGYQPQSPQQLRRFRFPSLGKIRSR